MIRSSLTRYAWLSIAAALVTITLKGAAYYLTGSVGLLSLTTDPSFCPLTPVLLV